jgi:hypothetical protein
MITNLPSGPWAEFKATLPKKTEFGGPALPKNLEFQGILEIGAWVPYDDFWNKLGQWLTGKSEDSVFYFLLESVPDEQADFEIDVESLCEEEIYNLNPGYRSALVAKDFSWVISSDDNQIFYVAGPKELYLLLTS